MRRMAILAAMALFGGCDDGSGGAPPSDAAPGDQAVADGAVEPRLDGGPADAAPVDQGRDGAPPVDAAGMDRGVAADATPGDAAVDLDDGIPGDRGSAPDMAAPDLAAADQAAPDMAPAPDMGPPPAQPPPIITEIMARNTDGLRDEDGASADWLELHNPGAAPFDLTGHFLSDDADAPERWAFPPISLPPDGYLVVFTSGKDRAPVDGELHTNFRLDADGESVYLFGPDGRALSAFEDFPAQVGNASWGLPMFEGRRPIVGSGAPARLWVGADPEGIAAPDFDDSGWIPIAQGAGIDARPAGSPGAALIRTDLSPYLGLATAFWLRIPLVLPASDDLEVELAFDDGIEAWLDGAPLYAEPQAERPEDQNMGPVQDRPPSRAASIVRVPLGARAAGPAVLTLRVVDAPVDDDLFFAHAALVERGVIIEPEARYLPMPTPGAPNFGLPGGLPPLIVELDRHQPLAAGEALPVSTRVIETDAPVEAVTLTWRAMFGEEQTIAMVQDGERWRAEIPADVAGPGEMIRWFVVATDAAGRSERFPPFLDPLDSERYYGTMVDPGPIETNLPVYHWFVEDLAAANTEAGTRGALWYGGELYDNIEIDLHGQATTTFPKKSYNFDFNRDHRFRVNDALERVKDFDLLTNYADKSKMRNTMAYGMFRDAGHDHHLVFPVRVHRNGEFFAVYEFVEDPDERWLRRMGYTEPLGAVYKCYDTLSDPNRSEKKTREEEGNADLAAFIDGISQAGAAQRDFLYDHVDFARMSNFLAMLFLTAGMDCCTKNYYAYHDLHTDTWWYMPWDIDLSLGRNWTGSYFDDRMFPQNPLYRGSNNRLVTALFALPEFVEMYERRVRTLVDEQMQPLATPYEDRYLENEADRLLAWIGADADLDNAAWGTWGIPQTQAEAVRIMKEDWMIPRRQFIYNTLVSQAAGELRTIIDGAPGATQGRWFVPGNDDLADRWTAPDFDDAGWAAGPLGIGYENGGGDYGGNIRSRVRPQDTHPGATNLFVRIRFDRGDAIDDPLVLRMKYEDGYVAWINGVEVARRNVQLGIPSWNASAGVRDDGVAVQFEDVDISAFADVLQPGENVLAIQLVNAGADSSDLLLLPALVEGQPGSDGPLPARQPDVVDVVIDRVQPAGDQSYLVVVNQEDFAVDLSRWRLAGRGIVHFFPSGTVIPAGGTLYVVANLPRFRERENGPSGGQGLLIQGNWAGDLLPDGEMVLEPPR